MIASTMLDWLCMDFLKVEVQGSLVTLSRANGNISPEFSAES